MFLDFFAFGMIIPVTPTFFNSDNWVLFELSTSPDQKKFYYGLMMGFFALSTFIFAPWLGSLSDRWGRRTALSITSLTNGVFYLFGAMAIIFKSPFLFILTRVIPGISGSSVFVVQSSLADLSNAQNKVKNLGIVGVAFGLGTILGAGSGGVLSNASFWGPISTLLPFYCAGGLGILNFLYVRLIYKETLLNRNRSPLSLWQGVDNIRKAFSSPGLRGLFFTAFLLSIGFSFFILFLPIYLKDMYDMGVDGVAGVYAFLGLWAAITQGGLIRFFAKLLKAEKLLVFTLIAFSGSYLIVLFADSVLLFYLFVPVVIIFQSLSFPNILALISNRAGPEIQGETIGMNQSLQSLASSMSAFFAAFSISFDSRMILYVGSGFAFLAWLAYLMQLRPKNKNQPLL